MTSLKKCVVSIKFYDGVEESDDNVGEVNATVHYDQDCTPLLRELNIRLSRDSDIPFEAVRNVNFEAFVDSLRNSTLPTPGSQDKASVKSAKDTPPTAKSRRPYRRLPDVDEVKRVFLDTGSVGELAAHFNVPRYTAQAWVDRLRRQGELKTKNG